MNESYQNPRIRKPAPEGFRHAETILQSPTGAVRIDGLIPDSEHFAPEAKRLSRKVLRNYGYSPAFWSDELNTIIKTREHYETLALPGGTAHRTLREVHDASLEPTESLRQIHYITMNEVGIELNGVAVYPTEYMFYDIESDSLERFYINTYTESIGQEELEAAFNLARQTGESVTSDRERIIFYAALTQMAGE